MPIESVSAAGICESGFTEEPRGRKFRMTRGRKYDIFQKGVACHQVTPEDGRGAVE
jgi:hypothetical protein